MRKRVQKKVLAALSLVVLSIGALTGCGSEEAESSKGQQKVDAQATDSTKEDSASDQDEKSSEEVVIRVGDFATAIFNDEFKVAYQKGIFDEIFKDDHVKIEVNPFENGPAANEAFLAGQLDIVNGIGDQPIIIGIGNDVKTTIVAGAAKQAANIGIITPKDKGIQSVEDLKGKTIGVFIGTYVHKSLIGILGDAGVSEDEVEIVNITSTSDADAAFENGDIDAYLSSSAYHIHKNVDEGDFIKIADCSKHPAFSYMVVADDFIEKHADLLEKFIAALYEAEQWIAENLDDSYQVIADYSGMDVETVKWVNKDAQRTIVWDDEYESNLKKTYTFLHDYDMITNELSDKEIESHIDTSFVKKVTGK